MICYRKHAFLDQKYFIIDTADKMMIGKSSEDIKYIMNKNCGTQMKWHINNASNQLAGFSIIHNKEWRKFHMSHTNCLVLKSQQDGKMIYSDIYSLYTPLQKIGSGTFSKVILVVNNIDQCEYACKTMKMDKKFSKNDMIYEIKTMQTLNHPAILKVKESYCDSNHFFIIMDFCKGGSLQQYIKANTLKSDQIIDIMKQVLKAVMYMHSCGFIHRDIKPENILLRNINDLSDLVICDFGFATRVEEIQTKYPWCGTPGYMAPEVMKYDNIHPYNEQCDVFSCGSLLYQLLTGDQLKVESQSSQIYEVDEKLEDKKVLAKISQEFFPILQKMLEEHPDLRSNAEEALSFFENMDLFKVQDNAEIIQPLLHISINKNKLC